MTGRAEGDAWPSSDAKAAPAEARPTGQQVQPAPRRLQVRDLLGGGRELILVHRGAEYHLRLTSNDKLILTK